MPKTQSAVQVDRKQQIRDLLSGRDLLPEKYLELAFQQEDVDRVDLFKFSGSWNPSKIDDFKEGFDPQTVSTYILEKFGPGRYRLSIVCEGEYMLHRSYAFGVVDEPPPPSGRFQAQHPPGTVLDARGNPVAYDPATGIARDLADSIRTQGLIRQHADLIAEADGRAAEREVRPAQLMISAMTSMMDVFKQLALKPPEKTPDPMTVMLPIIIKMMDSQQTLFLAMLEQKNKGGDGGGIRQVAEALQVLEKTLTGKIGDLIQGQDDKGTDWARVAEVASPMLEKAMGVLEASINRQPRTPVRLAIPPRPNPQLTPAAETVATTTEDAVKIHPDPEIDRALHEAADLGVEMLRSRDFKSLVKLLELNFPDFLEQIDLDANPIVYIQWLKRINPEFDKLRSEFADFVKWLDQQSQEPDETTPIPPAA